MDIQHTYLRTYRKRAQLTQADLASLMDLSDYSNVSRWEAGLRRPNIEMLLVYHLLFQIPVEELFERQKLELLSPICKRIEMRIQELKAIVPSDDRLAERIAFLEAALKRLTS